MESSTILVTGASGFLGSHITKCLLEQNKRVRGTVRSLESSKFLHDLVPEKRASLELFEAELLDISKWEQATQGCEFIIHTACPVPLANPKDVENKLFKPAVEGTKVVLEAALKSGVKKVVITSAFNTLWVGNEYRTITEEIWAIDGNEDAYNTAKIKQEKFVWEFFANNKGKIEITTLCPGLLVGPLLNKKQNISEEIIKELMSKKLPGIPDINFAVVDVRDAAAAHLQALQIPNTSGKRYIIANKSMSMKDITEVLAKEFEKYGYKFPKTLLKRCALKFDSMFDDKAKKLLAFYGRKIRFDNKLSLAELGIKYRPVEESIFEMAYSLIIFGFVPDKIKK